MTHPELHRTALRMWLQNSTMEAPPTLEERHSSPVIVHQLALLRLYWQSQFQSIGTKVGVRPTG